MTSPPPLFSASPLNHKSQCPVAGRTLKSLMPPPKRWRLFLGEVWESRGLKDLNFGKLFDTVSVLRYHWECAIFGERNPLTIRGLAKGGSKAGKVVKIPKMPP